MFKKEKILELRIEKNISRAWMAKQLKVSESLVSRWENGEDEPTQEQIKKIAEVLGVSVDHIFDDSMHVIEGEVRDFIPAE